MKQVRVIALLLCIIVFAKAEPHTTYENVEDKNKVATERKKQLLTKYFPDATKPIEDKDTLVAFLWELLESKTLAEGHELIYKLQTKTSKPPNDENAAIGFVVLRLYVDKLWREKTVGYTRETASAINVQNIPKFYKEEWKSIEETLFQLLLGEDGLKIKKESEEQMKQQKSLEKEAKDNSEKVEL